MQGISSSTQIRRVFLAMGSIASVAAASVAMAIQAPAAAAITVFVHGDMVRADHTEGVRYNFGIAGPNEQVAFSFSDANACISLGVCNPASAYSVNIGWGDNTSHSIGAFAQDPARNQVGNTATYDIVAPHAYSDEFNCPGGTCGYPISIVVTNTINSTTSGCCTPPAPYIVVGDWRLDSSPPATVTAYTGIPFSGAFGTFHDGNKLANAQDQDGSIEYHFTNGIIWGDNGSVADNPGTVTIGACQANSGTALTAGCIVNVLGTHTYTQVGQYTVTATIGDGLNQATVLVQATVNVLQARDGSHPSPPNPPGTRGSHPAPTVGAGPRTPPVRAAAARSVAAAAAPAQSIDAVWLEALQQLQGPAGFQRLFR